MVELNKAAPQAAGGEADPETQQAVQRVFSLVRNGTSNGGAKDADLTLDDVVRFYNVSRPYVAFMYGAFNTLDHDIKAEQTCG